jgi:hypothetical protein
MKKLGIYEKRFVTRKMPKLNYHYIIHYLYTNFKIIEKKLRFN